MILQSGAPSSKKKCKCQRGAAPSDPWHPLGTAGDVGKLQPCCRTNPSAAGVHWLFISTPAADGQCQMCCPPFLCIVFDGSHQNQPWAASSSETVFSRDKHSGKPVIGKNLSLPLHPSQPNRRQRLGARHRCFLHRRNAPCSRRAAATAADLPRRGLWQGGSSQGLQAEHSSEPCPSAPSQQRAHRCSSLCRPRGTTDSDGKRCHRLWLQGDKSHCSPGLVAVADVCGMRWVWRIGSCKS